MCGFPLRIASAKVRRASPEEGAGTRDGLHGRPWHRAESKICVEGGGAGALWRNAKSTGSAARMVLDSKAYLQLALE
jgi:hypothetical protein